MRSTEASHAQCLYSLCGVYRGPPKGMGRRDYMTPMTPMTSMNPHDPHDPL